MAIIKRFHKKNGKKKIFYQAQVYVRGVRLVHKRFDTKALAVIWHERQSEIGLLFTDRQAEALKYNAIQSSFNAGFTALKLPWRSTHICRHTFATIALMKTKNLSAVQASLGHTEQKYAKTIALLSSETGEKNS